MAATMRAPRIQALWLLPWLLVVFLTKFASTSPLKTIPKLAVHHRINLENPSTSTNLNPYNPEDHKTYYYDQTLDHFNYQPQSYATFRQRYVVNEKNWGGSSVAAPIFAYLGEESDLEGDVEAIGFLRDNAARFNALQVYIEHRFYGKSVPFGTRENAMRNATLRGYFNSAQALADYAEVLLYLKKHFSTQNSPVIVLGGSYGGMLATWFRLKYSHIALGAFASSAPVLYFDHITPSNAYYSVVTKDFLDASRSCHNTIKRSWGDIDRAAATSNGLSWLSKKFNTCNPLKDGSELKDYLDTLYCTAAQYDRPPRYPVTVVCDGIDGASQNSDNLDRIFAGIVAFRGYKSCYNLSEFFPSETLQGWRWQTCSEIVLPVGRGDQDTMFQADPFDMKTYSDSCKQDFGVTPRPHWITTYYGGLNIREVLKRFGSNIIFSNGLHDPYSSGGVLENISNSIVALVTQQGSHCLDLMPASQNDPEWLVRQKNEEVEIIHNWILQYYQDLFQSY
ncbi:hypothetical protein Dsin_000269 [Dipteronia sinensis]|uniref:Lysosomal Pro-X carboxypeptidase n=1 Tax=Dipteronia sinensis TaxID=43782 RepID=A0AAE0B1R7_9ROSI|nr:hypothetical protein Dsin_000269 [Dipteronia sinensis]